MFNWKWNLSEIVQDKPVKVFSTFSCGGGSSMGYKRAGFEVIGNVEIDPQMNALYKRNLHPRFSFEMDLREFNAIPDEQLPPELFDLDILDGSPPCSTFSTAGQREKNWGKAKQFREGQKLQTLDDLFFVYLDTVEKLRPRICVAENVSGLIKGNARGYVNEIFKRFRALGYEVQLFHLNAARMNVPQVRERCFFIANRCGYPKLTLAFDEPLILFGKIRSEQGNEPKPGPYKDLIAKRTPTDMSIADISLRVRGRFSGFNNRIYHDDRVAYTIVANGTDYRYYDAKTLSNQDYRNASTFPQDYDFQRCNVKYVTGMSVPPNMMANIATQIWKQWLDPEKGEDADGRDRDA